MSKQTKNNKRNKQKNKTQKHYGGYQNNTIITPTNTLNAANNTANNNEGILNVIGDKLSNYTGSTTNYLKEKGLRFINSTNHGTNTSSSSSTD